MDDFQRFGIFFVEIDTCNTGVVHLLEEFLKIRTSFVVYPGIGKETALVSSLEYADTEIDVFAETHIGETS